MACIDSYSKEGYECILDIFCSFSYDLLNGWGHSYMSGDVRIAMMSEMECEVVWSFFFVLFLRFFAVISCSY